MAADSASAVGQIVRDDRRALGGSRRRHDTGTCPTDPRPESATQPARRTKRLKPGKSPRARGIDLDARGFTSGRPHLDGRLRSAAAGWRTWGDGYVPPSYRYTSSRMLTI
jgi:hypothetical protein